MDRSTRIVSYYRKWKRKPTHRFRVQPPYEVPSYNDTDLKVREVLDLFLYRDMLTIVSHYLRAQPPTWMTASPWYLISDDKQTVTFLHRSGAVVVQQSIDQQPCIRFRFLTDPFFSGCSFAINIVKNDSNSSATPAIRRHGRHIWFNDKSNRAISRYQPWHTLDFYANLRDGGFRLFINGHYDAGDVWSNVTPDQFSTHRFSIIGVWKSLSSVRVEEV